MKTKLARIILPLAGLAVLISIVFYESTLPPRVLYMVQPEPPRAASASKVMLYDASGKTSPLPEADFDVVYKNWMGKEVRVQGTKFIDNCDADPISVPTESVGVTFKCGGYYYIPEFGALYHEDKDTVTLIEHGPYHLVRIR